MNKKLRDIIKETAPVNIVMHDWWFYMSAELFGETYYDDNAYIKYRQHGNNTFGVKLNRRDVWKYRIKQLGKKRGYIYRILNRRSPAIIEQNRVWWVPIELDINAMQEGAKYLLGNHDFSSFRASACQAKSPIKTLDKIDIYKKGDDQVCR